MKAIILNVESQNRMNSKIPMAQHEILWKQMGSYCSDMLESTNLFSEILIAASTEDLTIEAEDIFLMKVNAPLVSKETVIDYNKKFLNGEKASTPAFVFVRAGESPIFATDVDTADYDNEEFLLVDDKIKLYQASEVMKKRINERHMFNGVTIINSGQTYISPDIKIGCDTVIYPNTYIKGKGDIGEGCAIGPDCSLTNMTIGDKVEIVSSTAVGSSVGDNTHIGPYAYIRPTSQIGEAVKLGDFVEVKNSVIGNNSKASHLTYIGDSVVGKNVNFGCGTITGNYDGERKHKTVIGDNAFIGCNSNLIAPVKVGESAYVAGGSTITDDVPNETLAIARARQVIKLNWKKK